MTDTALRCSCGSLRGRVRDLSPKAGSHVVCYCDDCQAFARYLGSAETTLDPQGGSDIFQTSPARVSFQSGTLECVRLGPRGLFRWYAECCRSPVGNTIARPGLPFVGLLRSSLEASDEVLGPVRARVQARFALGEVSGPDVYATGPVGLGLKLIGRIAMSRLRGEHRASPFFDPAGQPVVEPIVLSEAQRAALVRVSAEPSPES